MKRKITTETLRHGERKVQLNSDKQTSSTLKEGMWEHALPIS